MMSNETYSSKFTKTDYLLQVIHYTIKRLTNLINWQIG
jgi:hypothetical protein